MTQFLLDTNHFSEIWKDRPSVTTRVRAIPAAHMAVSVPTIGELWFMVYNSRRERENRRRLTLLLRDFVVLNYDASAAIEFGRIKAELARAGQPIPDADIQIAGIARSHGLVLLTADAHFSFIADLTCEDWMV